jgi:hypothetical protein
LDFVGVNRGVEVEVWVMGKETREEMMGAGLLLLLLLVLGSTELFTVSS